MPGDPTEGRSRASSGVPMTADGLVLITGGSSGIGRHLAEAFLRRGNTVIIVSDQQARLTSALGELRSVSSRVAALQCDIGDRASVLRLRDEVLTEHGCPNVLINNAGFAVYR